VCEYYRSVRSSDFNLLFVGQAEFAYILGRENIHAASFQAFNDGRVDAFVGVDFDTPC
jgi:hypothetical protein